jgi:hypothetical protein
MTVTINGTNGISFADSSSQGSAGYTGFRNRIINGSFEVDQYKFFASHTIQNSNAVYLVDRFFGTSFGAAITGQIVTVLNQKRYRFTGATGCTGITFGTRLERANTFDIYGNTAVFSIKASSSSLTSINWTAYYANSTDAFGTLNSPTQTQIATGTFTINSTENKYSATFPVATGSGIAIVISTGALNSGATLTIGELQLEKGSVASPFEFRPIQTELELCQRYYLKQQLSGAYFQDAYQNIVQSYTVNNIPLPVTMRATPTMSFTGAAFTLSNIFTNNVSAINPSLYSWQLRCTAAGRFYAQAPGTGAFIVAEGVEL